MKKAELIKENEMLKAALRKILEYSTDEHLAKIVMENDYISSPYAFAVGQMESIANCALYDDMCSVEFKTEFFTEHL